MTRIPAISASLSCEPKCMIAKSLTGIGVRLIAVSPTAMTGALFGPMIAAASSATPSATAAASIPASAPAASTPTTERDLSCRSCFPITGRHSELPANRIGVPFIRAGRRRSGPSADGSASNGRYETDGATSAAGRTRPRRGHRPRPGPDRRAGPGGARRPPGVRAALRRAGRTGLRGGPAGAARSRPVRGSRPGGAARDLAHRLPVRPGQGQPGGLGPDHRAPPGGRPGPVGDRQLPPGGKGRAGPGFPRRRPGRGGGRHAGPPAGPPLPGRPDRAAARVDQTRLLRRLLLSAGRPVARGGPRHGQDADQGRLDQDARLPGGGVVKVIRADLHVLSGGYVLDALSEPERDSFEHHLQQCPLCQDEVRGLRETAARLGLAKTLDPPPQLRPRVLAAAYRTRQLPPPVTERLNTARHRARPRVRFPRLAA